MRMTPRIATTRLGEMEDLFRDSFRMALSLATGAMYGFLNTCSFDAFLCRASRMAKKVKKHQVPAAAAICQNDHLSTTDGLGVSRRPIPAHPTATPSCKAFDLGWQGI